MHTDEVDTNTLQKDPANADGGICDANANMYTRVDDVIFPRYSASTNIFPGNLSRHSRNIARLGMTIILAGLIFGNVMLSFKVSFKSTTSKPAAVEKLNESMLTCYLSTEQESKSSYFTETKCYVN